jgi:hypothetical protein
MDCAWQPQSTYKDANKLTLDLQKANLGCAPGRCVQQRRAGWQHSDAPCAARLSRSVDPTNPAPGRRWTNLNAKIGAGIIATLETNVCSQVLTAFSNLRRAAINKGFKCLQGARKPARARVCPAQRACRTLDSPDRRYQ